MSNSKIPATIITGFLGAGKTTLIRHLLQNAGDKRIALIINEFGDMGFDAEFLKGCSTKNCGDDDIVELTNGCICCTVADDFLPTIEALIDRDEAPEHIIIETSGLALPQPLVKAFSWPSVRSRVTVDGVVTVVDAAALSDGKIVQHEHKIQEQRLADEALDHESPIEELFEDQLKCADLIVMTKTDLVDEEGLKRAKGAIAGDVRKGVQYLNSANGNVPASVLLGLTAGAEDDMDARKSHHDDHDHEHDHDDFETFLVQGIVQSSPEATRRAVEQAMHIDGVLRIKGTIEIEGKNAPLAIQAVGTRVETWFSPERSGSQLVIIGEKGLDQQQIISLLKS